MRSSGQWCQKIWFGVLPNVLPVMMSSTLFYWEYNNRASTVLGLVGAGGIGMVLDDAMNLFRWTQVATVLLAIFAVVVAAEIVVNHIRKKII